MGRYRVKMLLGLFGLDILDAPHDLCLSRTGILGTVLEAAFDGSSVFHQKAFRGEAYLSLYFALLFAVRVGELNVASDWKHPDGIGLADLIRCDRKFLREIATGLEQIWEPIFEICQRPSPIRRVECDLFVPLLA